MVCHAPLIHTTYILATGTYTSSFIHILTQTGPLKRSALAEIGGHLTRRRLSDWNPFVQSLDYNQRNSLLSALIGSGAEGGRQLATFVRDDVLATSFTKSYILKDWVGLQEKIQVVP